MTTHVHFHDLWPDKKPFEEAKHKRSHGKFATMAGPGAQHNKPEPKSRLQTWQQGAAARVAAAFQSAQKQATELGKEAFSIPHDVETLTKGFDQPSTPLRENMGLRLAKNTGNYLKEMGKEVPETLWHAGNGLYQSAVNKVPMNDHQVNAWKSIGRKVVISTIMRSLDIAVPGAGLLAEAAGHAVGHAVGAIGGHAIEHATQHAIEHIAHHVVDHAAEEHEMKLFGSAARATHHLFGRSRRTQQQQQAQPHDSVFRDQQITPQMMKLLDDWLQTVAMSLVTAPIDMKSIMASMPKGNGDSGRFGPMFGGLGGNRIGDDGTSAGARKAWQTRHAHGEGQELRKTVTPPSTPKPSFEQMRAKAQEFPEPAAPKPKRPSSPKNPMKAVTPEGVRRDPSVPAPEKTIGATGYKTQSSFFHQGKGRDPKHRGGPAGAMPTGSISPGAKGQRLAEHEKTVRGQQAQTAERQREELRTLRTRQQAGETLTEQEKHRMKLLVREHGLGGMGQRQAPMSQGGPISPAKRHRGASIPVPTGYGQKHSWPLNRR